MKRAVANLIMALAILGLMGEVANAQGTTVPSVGLYWTYAGDPTAGAGVSAPRGQLLFRTDVASIWWKSGTASTAWTQLGINGGSIAVGIPANTVPKSDGSTFVSSAITDTGSAVAITSRPTSITNTNSAANALDITQTPTAGTTTNISGASVTYAGTVNATAAQIIVNGINADLTTTRSAGAFDVISQAGRFFSSGGTLVRGVRAGATADAVTTIASGVNASVAGTGVTNNAVLASSTATGTTNYGADISSTGAGTTNVGARVTATGAGTNTAFNTVAGNNYLNSTSGSTAVGGTNLSTISAKLHVTGDALVAATGANSSLTVTYAPVASGSLTRMAIAATNSGTFDTTVGAGTVFVSRLISTASRSGGANALTGIGLSTTSSGAQVNVALTTVDGGNYLNATSGSTGVGVALGGTLTSKFNVNGDSSFGLVNTATTSLWGHKKVEGTAPAASACGTGPGTPVGTDLAFRATTAADATGCTWTFSRTYTVVPVCVSRTEGGTLAPTCTVSATAITCTVAALSTTYHWMCMVPTGGT